MTGGSLVPSYFSNFAVVKAQGSEILIKPFHHEIFLFI